MKKLSIVVPVYYNEGSLPDLFKKLLDLRSQSAPLGVEIDLIFVDDGSKDNSLAKLLDFKQASSNVTVIKLSRNFGSVQAAKTGLRYAIGDCFLILAADLQDPPELIIEMLKRWLTGSKFVVARRTGRDDPLLSKLFSKFYYFCIRHLVDKDYPKGGFDMALMDKCMHNHLANSGKNIYIPLYAHWMGFKPDFIPYKRQERIHGKSRWGFWRKIHTFLDACLGFSYKPIRAISIIGLIVAGVSSLYGISVFIQALLGHKEVAGFATLVSLITFLLGVIILILGIIGEYVWRIYDQVSKIPETIIDEIY